MSSTSRRWPRFRSRRLRPLIRLCPRIVSNQGPGPDCPWNP